MDLASRSDPPSDESLHGRRAGSPSLSPALSIAAKSNDLLYSVYDDGNYSIYSIEPQDLLAGTAGPGIAG